MPFVFFYFFCKYCDSEFKYYKCILYMLSNALILYIQKKFALSEILILTITILQLFIYGFIVLKCSVSTSIINSVIITSVFNVCKGISCFIVYLTISKISINYIVILKYGDIAIAVMILFLFITFLYCILKTLCNDINKTKYFILFIIPIFFISITEAVILSSVYGRKIIWDSDLGLIEPIINYFEIFLLQIFACICLFSSLIIYKKLSNSIISEQKIKLLEQKAYEQNIYVNEAISRYNQTRSFRHDIKNHLTVLAQLLKSNKTDDAYKYILKLEKMSDTLSFPFVQTGNAAVDALLTSKFSVAAHKKIDIRCDIRLPDSNKIQDIDLCIVLSNAIDNAIEALSDLKNINKYINIKGKQKGNLYFINIENPLDKETDDVPKYGIGLENIKTAAEKYGGIVEIEISSGIFCLNILFVISCN